MSSIPLQGQAQIVDTPEAAAKTAAYIATDNNGYALASWVMGKVRIWENVRDRGYGRLWSEYWRMWRGKWAQEDAQRQSERSRVITPAIAQAIESSVSEVEEAVFSKEIWFDIADTVPPTEKGSAMQERDTLLQDFERVNVKDAISEAVLNGAIFGTGIVQINTEVRRERHPVRDAVSKALAPSARERVYVTVESIRPDEFIPDPAGKTIDAMLGCAIRRVKTQHSILERISQGIYRSQALAQIRPQHRQVNYDVDRAVDPQSIITVADADEIDIVEYHGKVPKLMLEQVLDTDAKHPDSIDELLDLTADENNSYDNESQLVEAIVTIANQSVLLRAVKNPFVMNDRSIIAFQYEKVPGRFWGRGVVEKGYNPQKALDATVRSYIDALGYVANPMLGIDSGRMPRGFKQNIHPGRIWLTQGAPDEVLRPVSMGALDANLFNQAQEMERMVQMGTGAFDTATALKNQSQSGANSATANSMLMGAFVKRAKRAIQNVDRNFLVPVVTKTLWRYMQFDPVRYPKHYDFQIKTTMGIVAREVEATQLTQLIGMIGEEFPQTRLIMARGVVENMAVANKAQILQQIDQQLQPNPQAQQQQQQMQQLQMQSVKADADLKSAQVQLVLAQTRDVIADSIKKAHESNMDVKNLQIEMQRLNNEISELENQREQTRISHAKLAIENKQADAQLLTAHAKVKQVNKPAAASASK